MNTSLLPNVLCLEQVDSHKNQFNLVIYNNQRCDALKKFKNIEETTIIDFRRKKKNYYLDN